MVVKETILVIASTYPRWVGDPEPAFVHELSRRLVPNFEVHVLCPHAPKALQHEVMDGVQIHRFRYAPVILELLVQSGGIMANLKARPWLCLLVAPFLLGLLIASFRLVRKIKPHCIHAHWIIPQGIVLAILQRLISLPPILLTSHGGDLFGLRGWSII